MAPPLAQSSPVGKEEQGRRESERRESGEGDEPGGSSGLQVLPYSTIIKHTKTCMKN
jgi:hypothetical protein